jgi:hypothetical protein
MILVENNSAYSLNDNFVLHQNYFKQNNNIEHKRSRSEHSFNYLSLYDNSLVECNMSKRKQFLRVNFDKFALLNEDKKISNIDMIRCNRNNMVPQETPIFYQWEKIKLPKIKLLPTNINKPSLDLSERSAERRMKIVFQQKREEEKRKVELHNRILHSNRNINESSSEVDIRKKKKSSSFYNNIDRLSNSSPNGSMESSFNNNGKYSPNFEKEDITIGTIENKKNINKFIPLANYNSTKGFKYLFSFKDYFCFIIKKY